METLMNLQGRWSDFATQFNRDTVSKLIKNEIAYIRLPLFASPVECEALVEGAIHEGFSPYRGVEPVINRIGNTVFEYSHISRRDYFNLNPEIRQVQDRIFARSFNPLERFLSHMRTHVAADVRVARNDEGAEYYAGLIRRIEKGTLLHVDFAPGEQPDWEVGLIEDQLVWNLYLRVSNSSSGRTHIFNREWTSEDNRLKEGIYGYNRSVVHGCDEAVFMPHVGDVIIFNTRNFHYVEPTDGERVAFTSAIGRTKDDAFILWS